MSQAEVGETKVALSRHQVREQQKCTDTPFAFAVPHMVLMDSSQSTRRQHQHEFLIYQTLKQSEISNWNCSYLVLQLTSVTNEHFEGAHSFERYPHGALRFARKSSFEFSNFRTSEKDCTPPSRNFEADTFPTPSNLSFVKIDARIDTHQPVL
jgi:hypothetical protein